uniref:Zgc:175136 n=1 Tax=Sinocyclocheilus grahami TaxID=75366 RepID=A0A672S1X3_SINGR
RTLQIQQICLVAFSVIGPEVKQLGNWNVPAYASAPLPHRQGTHDAPKERLFAGSNVKSDSKDCHTSAKSDNQDNHMINYKTSASVPKYDLSRFGHPSVQYESCTDAFKNVQPGSRLASTSSRSRSTLMRTLEVPESKPSRGESSYEVAKTSSKLQKASSSYDPFMKGNPVYSSMNPRKPSGSGFTYTEAKPSVVSSGPIFVVQGGGNAQGLREYSGHPDSVKPLGGPSHVDTYQASQISRLTESSQALRFGMTLQYGGHDCFHSEAPFRGQNIPFGTHCRSSIVSCGGILLKAPETTHPKFQQTYNIHGQPNQIFKPVYPSQSGAQRDVAKSTNASSGAILMMQVPENVQNRAQSNKPKVHPGFPERKVPFAPGQTAHQYQSGYQTFSVKGTTKQTKFSALKALYNSLPPSHLGQMPGQNVQKPVSSSSHCSKGVQSQESTRRITAIPSEFVQGAIRRISPTLSSSYRQVTQNSPAGFGQQGPVRFQEANLSI